VSDELSPTPEGKRCANAPSVGTSNAATGTRAILGVIYDRRHHTNVLHVARIDRTYVVVWPQEQRPTNMATIEAAVDMLMIDMALHSPSQANA
jgi:hypothetical protein